MTDSRPETAETILEDEAERIEAQLLAARVPAAWIAMASGEPRPEDEPGGEVDELDLELLAPLDADAQRVIIDRTISAFLKSRSSVDPRVAPPSTASRPQSPRRWWVTPLTNSFSAAAAVLLTLAAVDPQPLIGVTGRLDETRGAEAPGDVMEREEFLLACDVAGKQVAVVAVVAARVGSTAPEQGLAFRPHREKSGRTTVRVTAPEVGEWSIQCLVAEASSERHSRLTPTKLTVRPAP